jgi:hypothetical protein
MDSSDASNVYITGLDEATEYTFWMGEEFRRNQRNSADASACNTGRISPILDISLNDVSLLP